MSRLRIALLMSLTAAGLYWAAPAQAATPTLTWTGSDADPSTCGSHCNTNWSDSNNWQAGVAPTAGSTVNLVFPAPTCTTWGCAASNNDITGLTVANLSIAGAWGSGNSYPGPYILGGNQITMDSLTGTMGPPTPNGGALGNYVGLPIVLGQDETWTIQGISLGFSAVTGHHDLTVSLTGGSASFNGVNDLGNLRVLGQSSSANGGLVKLCSQDHIDPNGASLSVSHATLEAHGTIGPLTVTDGDLSMSGCWPDTNSLLTVQGDATLAGKSSLDYPTLTPGNGNPVRGVDYPSLDVRGSANLGTSTLNTWASCNQPLGTKYTLVSAQSITGQFMEPDGNPIPNGAVIEPYPGCGPGQGVVPYLRIDYITQSNSLRNQPAMVTATVVPPPSAGTLSSLLGIAGCVGNGSTPGSTDYCFETQNITSGVHAGWLALRAWSYAHGTPTGTVTSEYENDIPASSLSVSPDGSFTFSAGNLDIGNIYLQGWSNGKRTMSATNLGTTSHPLTYNIVSSSPTLTTYDDGDSQLFGASINYQGGLTTHQIVVWSSASTGIWDFTGTN